ncbi:MAG TPA: cytochrome P450 [Steroidobacteraceae bacterium]|nr:cytochrome P450 [Steroidobacteraceae bacterium]
MATVATETLKEPVQVGGVPLLGNALSMAKDPGRFFYECYRKYGPVFRLKVMNNTYTVLAGAEAANFMGTREGRDSLRSKEFWQGLVDEWGARRTLTGEDGETHQKLRAVMKHGYSKESVKGRYNELVEISDMVLARDWPLGKLVPVVQNMQYLVTEQLGAMLTGTSPREYVADIRTTILYILNILVTRQRPKFLLKDPRYRHAKKRVAELGQRMIDEYHATKGSRDPQRRNLVDDIMEAHERDPDLIPGSDLILSLTGPFVAGLDTVANTIGAFVYAVLKHPEAHARVLAEADALFGRGPIDEPDIRNLPVINGAIMEVMRMYPIAVAQMRTATRDFAFLGHRIRAGELLYVATAVPHYMHEYYPDPDRFDIDRYQKPRAEHLKPGVYSPYGRGTHTCLGKTLAEVQMALSMARLFYKLDLELESPDYELQTKVLPTPGPSMKFKVRVRGQRH